MTDLFTPPDSDRHGDTFVHEFDYDRLNNQQARVFRAMSSGCWMTLREIADVTGDPEASISARLRDFRKDGFGKLKVNKRRRGNPKRGLWEYRILMRAA